jgi:glutathione peroxidase
MATIYDFKALTSQGKELDFTTLRGKVLLIVNTASKCGYTPQLAGLEELHKQYHDKGLVILGFPCNQFGSQDPRTDEEIRNFCQVNYGVTFQIMKKVEVNGEHAHPLFKYLKEVTSQDSDLPVKPIRWNFNKFLISRDGLEITRYGSAKLPKNLTKDIEGLL